MSGELVANSLATQKINIIQKKVCNSRWQNSSIFLTKIWIKTQKAG